MADLPKFLSRVRYLTVAAAVACVMVAAFGVWRAVALRPERAEASKQKFLRKIQEGVGREVSFAHPGAGEGGVRASVNSVENFIFARSGLRFGGQAKNRLAELERRALEGTARRIMPQELSDIIAATALERLARMDDGEISRAAETLRGFDAPGLPDTFRRAREDVKLRASRVEYLSPEEFAAQVRWLRDADPATRALFRGAADSVVWNEVQKRRKILGEAVPEVFGDSDDDGLTPVAALLLAYSVTADDPLAYSEAGLRERMRELGEGISRSRGVSYPKPDGHRAYGPNGYLFSTPLDLALDEKAPHRLLDGIEERSARP